MHCPFCQHQDTRVIDSRVSEDGATIRPADRTLRELVAPRALLHDMLARLARPPHEGFARIVVRGRLGSGRRSVLATLAEAQNRRLGVVTHQLQVDSRNHHQEHDRYRCDGELGDEGND